MRIAVTGHRDLTARSALAVEAWIRDLLGSHAPGLVGVSCLAEGADQIFARVVLELGGTLEAVVCAADRRRALPATARELYDRLLGAAARTRRLPFAESTSHAHEAANLVMLEAVDELIAVWDGRPARGRGGTAEVVDEARRRGIPVRLVWPPGSARSSAYGRAAFDRFVINSYAAGK
ncbi:hypothetical protein [Actinomadura montaniterrae]|uniref:DUF2493 domain-containing protein n=1 Tax=Actinomadura montaniterrae TaxID=1803903 RepID=A0A6L3W1L2_9ACTN|nr:hypothetical protein [Actinomadura montaniterrae]KAB2380254.1 hypothetical protein F9B16_18130 [Actinomadura montaniterrae]